LKELGVFERRSMKKFLAVSTALSALASTTVSAQESNGCVDISENHGSSLVDLPFAPTGTPLLSRFGFAFNPGQDHHIQQILIAPGLPPEMMRLAFADKEPDDGDDNYCFNVTNFDVSDARIRPAVRGLDICREAGTCTVRLDKPAGDFVFVLIGFQLSFRAPFDHHLKDIAILENDGMLTISFADRHFDPSEDTILWSLQYAYVPGDLFAGVGEWSATGAHDRVIGQIPVGQVVLRGFRFTFTNDDHHIQQISVRPNTGGTVFLTYRDVNGDDPFDFEYRWAVLRPSGSAAR
jgi:hypothetical protein